MNYRVGCKNFDLHDKRVKTIGQGYTGNVYQYGDNALKIFDTEESIIDEETARYLTNIRTSRILLPKKLVYYKDKFKGYTMKLVSTKHKSKNLISISKNDLLDNIEMLEEDVSLLSNKRVLLNGMSPDNTIYNGNLYITDPSKYSILDSMDYDNIQNLDILNKFQLYLLLNNLIIRELNKIQIQYPGVNHLKKILDERDKDIDYSSYLDEVIGDNTSIKSLVKKMR